jgi:hypothetical protein
MKMIPLCWISGSRNSNYEQLPLLVAGSTLGFLFYPENVR